MLKSHINAVENHLLAISRIPANTGHSLHKGTPREAFIKEFLTSHLSERVAIGSGEIIAAESKPNQARNQIDIVIYNRDYPKLDFGGGIRGFLAESVVATIEVKSTLDKAAIEQSVRTAATVKGLARNIVQAFSAGYQPPSILSYVVAYDGPAKMDTAYNWILSAHASQGIVSPNLPVTSDQRVQMPSPSIDAVFVLGKGFVNYDNAPVGFINDQIRAQNPDIKWFIADSPDGNLLMLFLFMTQAVSGVSGSWLNPLPYLSGFAISPSNVKYGL